MWQSLGLQVISRDGARSPAGPFGCSADRLFLSSGELVEDVAKQVFQVKERCVKRCTVPSTSLFPPYSEYSCSPEMDSSTSKDGFPFTGFSAVSASGAPTRRFSSLVWFGLVGFSFGLVWFGLVGILTRVKHEVKCSV